MMHVAVSGCVRCVDVTGVHAACDAQTSPVMTMMHQQPSSSHLHYAPPSTSYSAGADGGATGVQSGVDRRAVCAVDTDTVVVSQLACSRPPPTHTDSICTDDGDLHVKTELV